jgi:hypothetical protein
MVNAQAAAADEPLLSFRVSAATINCDAVPQCSSEAAGRSQEIPDMRSHSDLSFLPTLKLSALLVLLLLSTRRLAIARRSAVSTFRLWMAR